MKKLSLIIIALLAIVGSLTAYSSLIPLVPIAPETDDFIVGDAMDNLVDNSSSMSSSAETILTETLIDTSVSSSLSQSIESAYLAYKDGIIGNGEKSLLFFYAGTCLACKQSDQNLKALYSTETPVMNTYRIDDSTASDLKKLYHVTELNTFVLVDGNGTALRTFLSASIEELRSILEAR